ncbi:MAG: Dabb family protein [Epsilonproteobacteria bacterium]|nr:Dabb family protein [Campylobacterota bacterium]
MVVHIVMFEFKEENKVQNIAKVKQELERLPSLIDGLQKMEVGVNFNDSERAMDLSLYSTFATKEDLQAYALHPEHLKVVELIKEVSVVSKVVDYVV